jgi:hypothetical protein
VIAVADELVERHGGQIPSDESSLRGLTGVGDYVASAVRCFAFGVPTVLLDANTKRIVARLTGAPGAVVEFEKALEAAGLTGRGITIHSLRSAAASVLIRQGLTPIEVAEILGHSDPHVTLKVYARLFDRRDVAARVRAAQGALLG